MEINLDIDIFDGLDPEKDKWDALIEAVMAGNVVPVIGPDIICDYKNGMNVNEFIISTITKQLKLHSNHKTFSQLAYDPEFLVRLNELGIKNNLNRNVIYGLVNNIFNNHRNIEQYFRPTSVLERLLSIKMFPFVITTSFVPVVENSMRSIWGSRNVNVLSFCRNPQKDTKPGVGDIFSTEDMSKPTVYYMFGKATSQPHSYALTDNDMLEFCQSWLSDQTRPRNLCAQLKDKYLLMLGCGYSDWLFRFIWFCMNKTADSKTKGMMVRNEFTHETLVEYLRRIDTFLPNNKNPEEIICEIEKRVKAYNKSHEGEWFSRPPQSGTDVFISYSRSDSCLAEAMYRFLSDQGITVWFDRDNLLGGTKFMDEIENAIENAKVFVPIISKNINKEAMSAHVYRKEWKKALDVQESMGNRTFIIPTHESGMNIYESDIPKAMKSHNSIPYGADMDFTLLLDSINEALNKLDAFKPQNIL